MPLYRFHGTTFFDGDPYDSDSRKFTSGQIYELPADDPYLLKYEDEFEPVPDPREQPSPATHAELLEEVVWLWNWVADYGELKYAWQRRQTLEECAVGIGFYQELAPDFKRGLNQLKPFAEDHTSEEHSAANGGEEQRKRSGMSVKEVTERLEQLRSQGEQFTSQHKLADQLGCSSGTINKAIRQTPSLQKWAKPATAQPRAQSINEFVTDRTAQSTEPDPADDAAIREYLEREDLTPDERAFFNGLSRNDQLDFLDDPDQHSRILGRKP